ncbi:MAG: hypothetical protein J7K68_01305 [Candidatus Diapherotrites archaeon]|nr:hypothetical protein [Candidatus Diapherotrites archaeon]
MSKPIKAPHLTYRKVVNQMKAWHKRFPITMNTPDSKPMMPPEMLERMEARPEEGMRPMPIGGISPVEMMVSGAKVLAIPAFAIFIIILAVIISFILNMIK